MCHSTLTWEGQGSGPLLLFLHANSLCAGVWGPVVRRLLPLLPPGATAVACDLRGHGDTFPPEVGDPSRDMRPYIPADVDFGWHAFGEDFARLVKGVAEQYGRAPDACVTHSFSGDCALMRLSEPAGDVQVKRMILLDPVLADAEGAQAGAQRLAKGTRRLHEREAAGFDSPEAVGEGLEKVLRGALAKDGLHPEAKAAFAQYGAHKIRGTQGKWRLKCDRLDEAEVYLNRVALADFLQDRSVATDVQLVFSAKRRGKPEDQEAFFARDRRQAERVVERCRQGSAVHTMEGVGHFLVLEDPDGVAETIARLL